MNPEPNLIFFGGSFDPPHRGHAACLALAAARFAHAELQVVPAYQPAAAGGGAKTPSASYADRVVMCRLAFAGVAQTSEIEAELPRPNRTVNTLRALRARHAKCHMGWLLGLDQWLSFANWFAPIEILQLADVIVVGRDHGDRRWLDVLPQLARDWQIASHSELAYSAALGARVFYLGNSGSLASSTRLREVCATERAAQAELSEEVSKYIKQHALYGAAGMVRSEV